MLVIEKYLGRVGGHEHTQVLAIEALVGSRDKIFVTGSDSVPEGLGKVTILNILSTNRDHLERPEWAVTHDVQALSKLLNTEQLTKIVPVLFPHAETHDIRVCLSLVAARPTSTRFYLRILVEREIYRLTEVERGHLRQAVVTGTITLLTETRTMSNLLKERYLLDSRDCMLLPCNIFPETYEPYIAKTGFHSRRFRVGYLGGFRTEKGSNLVPDILRHLRKQLNASKSDVEIDFIMQKPPRHMRSRPLRYDFKLSHGAGWPLPSKKIRLIILPLGISTEKFKETLRSTDLLLLPYSHATYNHRGSGILIDGVMARKPLVYTHGMGMTEFLEFGNAEAAAEDPADYAAKIIKLISNHVAYQAQAQHAALVMEEQICKTTDFLKLILSVSTREHQKPHPEARRDESSE